jgi:hypothetical protein
VIVQVVELNKVSSESKAKAAYDIQELSSQHAEEMKKMFDRHEAVLYEEQNKYETLRIGKVTNMFQLLLLSTLLQNLTHHLNLTAD